MKQYNVKPFQFSNKMGEEGNTIQRSTPIAYVDRQRPYYLFSSQHEKLLKTPQLPKCLLQVIMLF